MPEPTPGAKMTMVDQGLLQRIGAKLTNWITGRHPDATPQGGQQVPIRHEPQLMVPVPNNNLVTPVNAVFNPGNPITPMLPTQDVAGRRWDYPVASNISTQVRQYEGVSHEMLRNLADGCNQVRLAIETRKDQMAKLTFKVLPRMQGHQVVRSKGDSRGQEVEDFFRKPDRKTPWDSWQRQIVEEVMVTDAPSIYIQRTLDGRPYALDLVDGATIRPLIDESGRQPVAPAPAYQQVLKGVPAINYTVDELIYAPRNLRVNKLYGYSPTEQIIMTINIALRREVAKLSLYTQGNIPDAIIGVPKTWTPDQISAFQEYWDSMTADQQSRRKAKFVPGEMTFQQTRPNEIMMDPADEWLARVVCYAFSLPPLPFVKQQNRATAATALETALEEGLLPLMTWFKTVLDHIVQSVFGYDDLEIVWDDVRKADPAEMENRNAAMIKDGRKSYDEVRAEMGLDPYGIGPVIFGIGNLGFMSVEALKDAIKQGLDRATPPMSVDAWGNQIPGAGMPGAGMPGAGMPGAPGGGLHPGAMDALRGLPPGLLEAVGLGGVVDDAGGGENDPEALIEAASQPIQPAPEQRRALAGNVVVHPAVLRTLKMAEKSLGRRA